MRVVRRVETERSDPGILKQALRENDHVQNALNVKNFRTFAQQVKGAQVTEISVERQDGGKAPKLKYSARDARSRRIFNGEWMLDASGADAGEKEFLALAGKDFAVRRRDSAADKT
jgi:hypothetical protein